MGWFRVDDEFLTNPKVLGLSPAAKVLYVSGLAYCSTNLTDGHIPAVALGLVAAAGNVSGKCAENLVAAGLWHKKNDGWDVHDYLEHQDPAERIRARRTANRERVQTWRDLRRNQKRNPTGNAVGDGVTPDVTNGVGNGVGNANYSTAQHLIPPTPLVGGPEGSPSDGTTDEPKPHPDRAVIDHLAAQIGWTSRRRRAELATVWDWGLRVLDRRVLEETLAGCRGAVHPNYLRRAVTSRAAAG